MYIQDIILSLIQFWKERGFTFLSSYDIPKGAATFSREMIFRLLKKQDTQMCFVERCSRSQDAIYRENGKRLFQHHQFEVISLNSKPKHDMLALYLKSIQKIGLSSSTHAIEMLEDNWNQTSLNARGFGWEVRCDGIEITQITHFTGIGSVEFNSFRPFELAYGIERIACIVQKKNSIFDTMWSPTMSFRDLFANWERENVACSDATNISDNLVILNSLLKTAESLRTTHPMSAYDYCVLASLFLNKISFRLEELIVRKFLSTIESLAKQILV